jgi:sec-independent protein translocase protein TatC
MSDLTFWQHADILRQTLLRILAIISVGFCLSLFFYKPLMQLLTRPQGLQVLEIKQKRLFNPEGETVYTLANNEQLLEKTPKVKELPGNTFLIPKGESLLLNCTELTKLKIFGPLEGMISTFKIAFWAAVSLTSPFWLYLILIFIAPALQKETTRLLFRFWALTTGLFFSGLLFAWSVTLPWANHFLLMFNSEIGENLWGFSLYLDYTLTLLLATGLAFSSMALLLFLVHFGIITQSHLKTKRRHAIVAIFIISAILTPPDVFTQFMLAIPLMGLYEAVVFYAFFCRTRNSINVTV